MKLPEFLGKLIQRFSKSEHTKQMTTKEKWMLFLLVGLLLAVIFFPTGEKNTNALIKSKEEGKQEQGGSEFISAGTGTSLNQYEIYLSGRLEEILSEMDGAGKVQAWVTLAGSSEKVLVQERDYEESLLQEADSVGGTRTEEKNDVNETVITNSSGDPYVVKTLQPKVEGLLGTSLYFKGLSIGCYLRYRWGGQVFNSSLFQKVENIGTQEIYNNQDKRALYDRWSENNREAYFKGISLVQRTEKSSRFVMDDNSLVGESFNIGYEFPDRIVRKMRLGALNVQLTSSDIFRATSVRVERGIDYPFARTVTMSVGITF